MKSKWESEKENLKQLILVEKLSYEEIGRRYGCTGSNIKKVALRLGIELEQRRSINETETFNKDSVKAPIKICLNCGKEFKHLSGYSGKYCCSQCFAEHKHKIGYNKILIGDSSIMRANYVPSQFKPDIIKEQNGVCAICGMPLITNVIIYVVYAPTVIHSQIPINQKINAENEVTIVIENMRETCEIEILQF